MSELEADPLALFEAGVHVAPQSEEGRRQAAILAEEICTKNQGTNHQKFQKSGILANPMCWLPYSLWFN